MIKPSASFVFLTLITIAISCNLSDRPDESPQDSPKIKFSVDSTAGNVTTLSPILDAGTGGMSVDQEGNIMMADFGAYLNDMGEKGDKIFKISPKGESNVWKTGFLGASGNNFDSKGNLFQSNVGGNFITKVTSEGESLNFTKKGLSSPVGIQIDQNDDLYVCSCGNNTIQKISKDGVSRRFLKSKLLNCPNGITMDQTGTLYVSNFYNGAVVKILPDGSASIFAIIPGGNNGHLTYYNSFLYVVARSAHQIYKVSLDGEIQLFAGSGKKGNDNGDALKASFCYPNDIAIALDKSAIYINEVADTTSKGILLFPTLVRKIELN